MYGPQHKQIQMRTRFPLAAPTSAGALPRADVRGEPLPADSDALSSSDSKLSELICLMPAALHCQTLTIQPCSFRILMLLLFSPSLSHTAAVTAAELPRPR